METRNQMGNGYDSPVTQFGRVEATFPPQMWGHKPGGRAGCGRLAWALALAACCVKDPVCTYGCVV